MQYLLNATVIWLISLLAFELFFRRETVHWLNRAYLLATLALGFLLPLWQWQQNGIITNSIVRSPVLQATQVREQIVRATTFRPAAQTHSMNWLLLVYLFGVLASLVVVLHAVTTCIILYRKGGKVQEQGYILVETGKAHGPFSFFGIIFLSGKDDYSEEELQLVLQHELQHARRLHSIDVLLLQILKTVLWFHPLMYWYDKRLRMVHEYEADFAGKENTVVYGQFLIEQALLQHAPAITHSFHHSPVKTRIIMLMRNKTSRTRMTKYLLALPMIAFFSLACTRDRHPMRLERKGNIIYCNGNAIEVNTVPNRHIGWSTSVDSTGSIIPNTIDSFPIKLNNEKIYEEDELTTAPKPDMGGINAAQFIFGRMEGLFNRLGDGTYICATSNCVLDKTGRVVYFEEEGISDRLSELKSGHTAQMNHISRMLHSGGVLMKSEDTGAEKSNVRLKIAHTDNKEVQAALPSGGIPIANFKPTVTAPIPPELKAEIDAALQETLLELKFFPGKKDGKAVPAFADNVVDLSMQYSIQVVQHHARLVEGMHRGTGMARR